MVRRCFFVMRPRKRVHLSLKIANFVHLVKLRLLSCLRVLRRFFFNELTNAFAAFVANPPVSL